MASQRVMVKKEIDAQRQRIGSFMDSSFRRSMDSLVERAHTTARCQAELAKIKAELRKAEDELVRVLTVKTRKEARQMGLRDSISASKSRIEVLTRNLQLQRSKKAEYRAIISQQLRALPTYQDNAGKAVKDKGDIHGAILWYNQALGFHVEAGHGIRFKFINIDASDPNREYSFTIHYGDDVYTLLDCNPQLNSIKELVQELNYTNDLFRFVRLMREKFLKATLSSNQNQDPSVISMTAPSSSLSIDSSTFTPVWGTK